MAQAWDAYAEDAERRGKKGLPGTRVTVNAHILPAFGSTQVVDLTQWMVEKWHSGIAKSPARVRSGKDGKPAYREAPASEDEKRARRASANRILAILKAILNFAKRRGLSRASGEAWREAKPFEGTNASRQRFLTPEESQRLVNACPPDFRLLVQGALFTGARFSELARMLVSDFKAANGKVYVGPSKNSPNPRYVVLTEEGQAFFLAATAGRGGRGDLSARVPKQPKPQQPHDPAALA
ncbi:MAG: tyrosine-type recombinase/integrase [Chitinophagaceae bacterium]|nr:tyrosine-type recombinase/integrase [Chitinophagaceae bacterium]